MFQHIDFFSLFYYVGLAPTEEFSVTYVNYVLCGLIALFLLFIIFHKKKKRQKIIRDQQQDPEFVFDLGEKRLPTQMQGLRQPAPTQEQLNSGVTLVAVTAVPSEPGVLNRLMEAPPESLGLPAPPLPLQEEAKKTVAALPSLKERVPVHSEEQTSAPPPIAPPAVSSSDPENRHTQFFASPPPQPRKPAKPT